MDNLGNWIKYEESLISPLMGINNDMFNEHKDKKELILAFRLIHGDKKRKYFDITWRMIWILVKYKVIWGMDITFTVSKACDREEYYVQFFVE